MDYIKISEEYSKVQEQLNLIAKFLLEDKIGAIPTETFYALACNPFSEKALMRLVELKGRPQNKPILLLLGKLEDLSLVVERIPSLALKLIKVFWPGPLTLVLPARKDLSKILTAGSNKIGVRLSSCELTRRIAQAFGRPITGTSANKSGEKPCALPEEVLKVLPEIDFIVDGGITLGGSPSTVVEILDKKKISLIREGAIPWEKILEVI